MVTSCSWRGFTRVLTYVETRKARGKYVSNDSLEERTEVAREGSLNQ